MRTIESCRHCGYRIPSTAAICPGCGRRHVTRMEPVKPPREVGSRRKTKAAEVAAEVAAQAAAAPAEAAPSVAVPEPPAPRGTPRHGPLLRMARLTRWLLALTAWIAAAFVIAASARYVVDIDSVSEEIAPERLRDIVEITHWIGVAALVSFGLAVAGAVTWSRQAHRNLRALKLTSTWTSAWSLGGWLVPGAEAKSSKRTVDALWRDTSPAVANLPRRGFDRRPISRVVLHWWTLWMAVPAAGLLAVAVVAGVDSFDQDNALYGVAGAAFAVAAVRALYDVVGLVTVAQAHRAEAVLRDRVATMPWTDHDDGWSVDAPLGDEDLEDDFGETRAEPPATTTSLGGWRA